MNRHRVLTSSTGYNIPILVCVFETATEEDAAVQERDQLRYDRHKERERQRRLARAHPEKRSKLERDRDRDVTEKIALGLPSASKSQESLFDQRLFNQTKVGMYMWSQGYEGCYVYSIACEV